MTLPVSDRDRSMLGEAGTGCTGFVLWYGEFRKGYFKAAAYSIVAIAALIHLAPHEDA